MVDEQPDPAPVPLSPEERRRLRQDTLRTVRLLAESLEQTNDAPDADSALLLARVQAAIEPLRATTAGFSGEGSLTVSGQAGLVSGPRLGGDGSLQVGVVHLLQPDSAAQGHTATSPVVVTGTGSATATVTVTGTGHPVPSGTASGTVTWTGTATGSAPPETFEITADDAPWLLWQILLRLDDLADPTRPGLTYGQVYDRLVATLGLLLALLPYLA